MQELVEQMLLLARSDQQKEQGQELPLEPVDLSELTEGVLLMFEPVAYEAGKALSDSAITPGLVVQGNRAALSRLIDILLDNAVKYTPAGGTISVTLEERGKQAQLQVTNQGTPIPKEEQEKIFQRFYRSDAARTGEGFGLGLAIARSIAEEHGATLSADSDGVQFNTFTCTLPLRQD